MADPCERKEEYRRYRRTGPAREVGDISRSPADAPVPRKTKAQAIADLEAAVDRDINARNAIQPPQCEGCGHAGDTEEKKEYFARGQHQWRETYSLTDAGGATVTGDALYTLTATVDIETTIFTRICAPKGFGDKLAMLPGFDFEVQADVLARLDYGLMIELANRDPLALKALGVGRERATKA